MGRLDVRSPQDAATQRTFTRALIDDLICLERMIAAGSIESEVRRLGVEQELVLVDSGCRPAPRAMEVLADLGGGHFTTELVTFQLEFNDAPRELSGDCLRELERSLNEHLDEVRVAAAKYDCRPLMVGILPTLVLSDMVLDNMAPMERYRALNEALLGMCGGSFRVHIHGADELSLQCDSVMLEGCNSSFQVHLQSDPEEFPRLYNAAQAVLGPVVAASTGSPLLFGKRLWAETRIPLFEQAVSMRGAGHHLRQNAPRVHFGNDWVRESILELYQEDVARVPSVLGVEAPEDSLALLERGEIPRLKALQMFNSTVYRWNRPCFGRHEGKPHLRIECRPLPSGPTVIDEVANAALWAGVVLGVAQEYPDLTQRIPFSDVKANFVAAGRRGLRTGFDWLDGRAVSAPRLLEDELLPLARQGLSDAGVDSESVDRYLGVIEERVRTGQTASRWLERSYLDLKPALPGGHSFALLTAAYARRQEKGEPCWSWSYANLEEEMDWSQHYQRVEQIMTTDLFTVRADELIDLAALVMQWKKVRQLPVEDDQRRIVGVVTFGDVLRLLSLRGTGEEQRVPVREVMQPDPPTVTPQTSTAEALEVMREHRAMSLPVVEGGELVGIVSLADYLPLLQRILPAKGSEEAPAPVET